MLQMIRKIYLFSLCFIILSAFVGCEKTVKENDKFISSLEDVNIVYNNNYTANNTISFFIYSNNKYEYLRVGMESVQPIEYSYEIFPVDVMQGSDVSYLVHQKFDFLAYGELEQAINEEWVKGILPTELLNDRDALYEKGMKHFKTYEDYSMYGYYKVNIMFDSNAFTTENKIQKISLYDGDLLLKEYETNIEFLGEYDHGNDEGIVPVTFSKVGYREYNDGLHLFTNVIGMKANGDVVIEELKLLNNNLDITLGRMMVIRGKQQLVVEQIENLTLEKGDQLFVEVHIERRQRNSYLHTTNALIELIYVDEYGVRNRSSFDSGVVNERFSGEDVFLLVNGNEIDRYYEYLYRYHNIDLWNSLEIGW